VAIIPDHQPLHTGPGIRDIASSSAPEPGLEQIAALERIDQVDDEVGSSICRLG
jgi:hypothetical protein